MENNTSGLLCTLLLKDDGAAMHGFETTGKRTSPIGNIEEINLSCSEDNLSLRTCFYQLGKAWLTNIEKKAITGSIEPLYSYPRASIHCNWALFWTTLSKRSFSPFKEKAFTPENPLCFGRFLAATCGRDREASLQSSLSILQDTDFLGTNGTLGGKIPHGL